MENNVKTKKKKVVTDCDSNSQDAFGGNNTLRGKMYERKYEKKSQEKQLVGLFF